MYPAFKASRLDPIEALNCGNHDQPSSIWLIAIAPAVGGARVVCGGGARRRRRRQPPAPSTAGSARTSGKPSRSWSKDGPGARPEDRDENLRIAPNPGADRLAGSLTPEYDAGILLPRGTRHEEVYDAASIQKRRSRRSQRLPARRQLASAILADAGMINRFGKVDEGTTVTDFDEEEIARKHTLSASLAYAEWNKQKINLIDTPGIGNFLADALAALQRRRRRARRRRRGRPASWSRPRRCGRAAEELGAAAAWSSSTASTASAPASSGRWRRCAKLVQPHGHPDPAADRRGKRLPRRRRSGVEEGVRASRPTAAASSPRAPFRPT